MKFGLVRGKFATSFDGIAVLVGVIAAVIFTYRLGQKSVL